MAKPGSARSPAYVLRFLVGAILVATLVSCALAARADADSIVWRRFRVGELPGSMGGARLERATSCL
jgi:hypothetical protein